MKSPRRRLEGVTLLEIMVVLVIIGIGASGLTLSLGALTRTSLKSAAGRLAAASRYAYNRALVQGTTTRLAFELGGNWFSIEEAHGKVTLARGDEAQARAVESDEEGGEEAPGAVDPWAAAQSRITNALQPTLGASPFGPITSPEGTALDRYSKVDLGRRVQIVRLIVGHEPVPREHGRGAIYFFPGGVTEHAVVHLSDGGDGLYALEVHPLTGRARVHADAYVPDQLLDDPEDLDESEVE